MKSSQVSNPSGGGGATYPNTSHQKRATRSGSAQSKVTWNFLIEDIGAPYQWVSVAARTAFADGSQPIRVRARRAGPRRAAPIRQGYTDVDCVHHPEVGSDFHVVWLYRP